MQNKVKKYIRKLIENKLALSSLIISYRFGLFFSLYKRDTKWVIIVNIIQMSLVTLINILVLLEVKLSCCCKTKEKKEAREKKQ